MGDRKRDEGDCDGDNRVHGGPPGAQDVLNVQYILYVLIAQAGRSAPRREVTHHQLGNLVDERGMAEPVRLVAAEPAQERFGGARDHDCGSAGSTGRSWAAYARMNRSVPRARERRDPPA